MLTVKKAVRLGIVYEAAVERRIKLKNKMVIVRDRINDRIKYGVKIKETVKEM